MATAKLEVFLTLKDQMSKSLQGVKNSFGTLRGEVQRTERQFLSMGAAMLGIGGLLFGFKKVMDTAIEFESAFAGVRKTVEATEAEFAQLSESLVEMSTKIPVAAKELARIQELAGQLGVSGVKALTKFTETVAKIAVTTNLTTESAATNFARIANVMQEPLENVDRMGAVIVDLGNNFATTEMEITDFATRIAGMGKQAGLTTGEILAIGAAMSSVGIRAEAGGTAVQKVLLSLIQQGKRGSGAFLDFVQSITDAGDNASQILEELGFKEARVQRAFLSLAGAGGILERALDTQNKAWEENNALNEEAAKRFETTASKVKLAQNQFDKLAINMGAVLLPALNRVLGVLDTMLVKLESLAQVAGKFGVKSENLLTDVTRARLANLGVLVEGEKQPTPTGAVTETPAGGGAFAGLKSEMDSFKQVFSELQTKIDSIGSQSAKIAMGTINTLTKGIGNAFANMIVNGKNFGESMKQVFTQMLGQFIAAIVQMIAQWVIMQGIGKAMQAASVATSTAMASLMTAIWTPAATLATIATGGAAAAAAPGAIGASMAASQSLTIASGGAAWAALAGLGGATAMADGGVVTRPTLAVIGEAGPEAVIPLGTGGAGININFENANFSNDSDLDEIFTELSDMLDERRRSRI